MFYNGCHKILLFIEEMFIFALIVVINKTNKFSTVWPKFVVKSRCFRHLFVISQQEKLRLLWEKLLL